MLTMLGRFLRKIRIDKAEIIADMSEMLGVTASYVSAVENGKRQFPQEWRNLIVRHYRLDEKRRAEFDKLIMDSVKQVTISTEKGSELQKDVVFTFARRIAELPSEKLNEIRKLLGDDEN